MNNFSLFRNFWMSAEYFQRRSLWKYLMAKIAEKEAKASAANGLKSNIREKAISLILAQKVDTVNKTAYQ